MGKLFLQQSQRSKGRRGSPWWILRTGLRSGTFNSILFCGLKQVMWLSTKSKGGVGYGTTSGKDRNSQGAKGMDTGGGEYKGPMIPITTEMTFRKKDDIISSRRNRG